MEVGIMIQITIKIDEKEFTSPQAAKKFIDQIFSINETKHLDKLDLAIQEARSMKKRMLFL
ncbi:MAG: hypothetical protein LBP70_02710 [Mycoplasmataceae bacterium]|jgi:hypothetical protein|nr:hypothetical protein [Mycoplasmataceae bacterium]